MNCVGHQSPGLWRHPRDRSAEYKSLAYWTDVAKILERGKFDGLFIADVLGVYDVYGGNLDVALRNSTQIPVNDPTLLVPAMAMVTEHLGFGITCTLSFEPPYPFARRMSSLDHLTDGRVGWNIVTGYLNSAAKGVSGTDQTAHDTRYEIGDEYMEVMYKLWEGSWEDGAVVRDKSRGIFTDAVHLSEPSPQRTPVLYQAGASTKGRAFAATHAECVFVAAPTKRVLAPRVADLRRSAREQGRNPSDILIFTLVTVIVGHTDAEAQAKHDEYRHYVSHEGALALMAGWTGIDFAQYDLDAPIKYIHNDAIQSATEALTSADPDRVWTVREIAEFGGIGGLGPVIVGSPARVADELQAWVQETGVDGFNLAYAVTPETFTDVVDLCTRVAAARRVQDRIRAGHAARKAVWPWCTSGGAASGNRLSPLAPAAGSGCRRAGRLRPAPCPSLPPSRFRSRPSSTLLSVIPAAKLSATVVGARGPAGRLGTFVPGSRPLPRRCTACRRRTLSRLAAITPRPSACGPRGGAARRARAAPDAARPHNRTHGMAARDRAGLSLRRPARSGRRLAHGFAAGRKPDHDPGRCPPALGPPP
jgi:alkanesulfonate monooxygenase